MKCHHHLSCWITGKEINMHDLGWDWPHQNSTNIKAFTAYPVIMNFHSRVISPYVVLPVALAKNLCPGIFIRSLHHSILTPLMVIRANKSKIQQPIKRRNNTLFSCNFFFCWLSLLIWCRCVFTPFHPISMLLSCASKWIIYEYQRRAFNVS